MALLELSYLLVPLTSRPFLFGAEGYSRMLFSSARLVAAAVLPKLVSGFPAIVLSCIIRLSVLVLLCLDCVCCPLALIPLKPK